jgi:hypothetical protein
MQLNMAHEVGTLNQVEPTFVRFRSKAFMLISAPFEEAVCAGRRLCLLATFPLNLVMAFLRITLLHTNTPL